MLGCSSRCTIVGTSGKMVVSQDGSDLSMLVNGKLTYTGTVSGSAFAVRYHLSQSEPGCSASITSNFTGNDFTIANGSGFSGVVDAKVVTSGCGTASIDCTVTASYVATAAPGAKAVGREAGKRAAGAVGPGDAVGQALAVVAEGLHP